MSEKLIKAVVSKEDIEAYADRKNSAEMPYEELVRRYAKMKVANKALKQHVHNLERKSAMQQVLVDNYQTELLETRTENIVLSNENWKLQEGILSPVKLTQGAARAIKG